MPRQARKKSESGIYHIILRGINRQQIFEDSDDYAHFLWILRKCKDISSFQLFAYCLMSNHVHLLIKIINDPVEQVVKRIAGRYVYWYNIKYQRTGHLFQDRFKSEPVEDNSYLLTVLRYIHQNPLKAGICQKISEFPYSSYREYLTEKKIVDCEFVESIIPKRTFINFNDENNEDRCLDDDYSRIKRVTDDQAKNIIAQITNCKNVTDFQKLSQYSKAYYIKQIHDNGVSIRQINRLTGISKGMVERYIR